MTDLASLDSKIRGWLKRVPLSAIVILLKAIHQELQWRNRAHSSLDVRFIGQGPRTEDSTLPGSRRVAALSRPVHGLR
jgi:hypothetical protein